jgi:hypothetical protein
VNRVDGQAGEFSLATPVEGHPAGMCPPGQHGLLVHIWYLIGFQNRVLVLIRWSFSFATRGRGARLITGASTNSER